MNIKWVVVLFPPYNPEIPNNCAMNPGWKLIAGAQAFPKVVSLSKQTTGNFGK